MPCNELYDAPRIKEYAKSAKSAKQRAQLQQQATALMVARRLTGAKV